MPQMEFTDRGIRALSAPTKDERERQYFERLRGASRSLALYVSYGGSRTWRVVYYVGGKPRSRRLGAYPELSVKAARKLALEFDAGVAAASAEAGTFKKVAQEWVADHVDKKRLRTKYEIERQLKLYVYPELGAASIFEINRRDVNRLLATIEKKHGAPQADAVLATIRAIMQWYSVQDHRFNSPIVKGMKRDKRSVAEKSRRRVLDDDELRAIWAACDHVGVFGVLVRMLLLTAQRVGKVASMRWEDIADGRWTLPAQHREKGHIGCVDLPPMALELLNAVPRVVGNPYVFPATLGKSKRFNAFSQLKSELDALLPENMPPWRLHDLRRTARSRMSKIGIPRDIAERTLGHAIPGVEGVYDRYAYTEEKSEALRKLAGHIAQTLDPPARSNVVPLPVGR